MEKIHCLDLYGLVQVPHLQRTVLKLGSPAVVGDVETVAAVTEIHSRWEGKNPL